MRISVKDLVSYVLIASIFITGEGIVDIGFRMYWYYPFYMLFMVYGLIKFKKIEVKILLVLGFIVLYSVLTFNTGLSLVVKQVLNICFSTLVFYFFLNHEKSDYNELFRKYTTFAKLILTLGFVQVVFFAAGIGGIFLSLFPWLKSYDVSIRLQSLTQEPAFFALTMAPVVFFGLHNIFYRTNYFFNQRWSYLFILGYILTFSSLAYFAVLLMLLILYLKNFSYAKLALMSVAMAGIISFGLLAYYAIAAIRVRVDDTIIAFSNDFFETDVYMTVNPSTYAIASNYYIATKAFEKNPLTGNGLGTYELIYDKYIPDKVANSPVPYFKVNRADGAAMSLRLLSETGLIGLCLFLFFVIAYKVRSRIYFSSDLDILWALNAGIFVLIILVLIRNGNYTAHGRILFLFIYYYTYHIAKQKVLLRRNIE